MAHISRRSLVLGSLATGATGLAAAVTAAPATASGLLRPAAPALVRNRLSLPSGIQFGDAGTDSAVLWSRSSAPGRLVATLRAVDADGTAIRGKGAFKRTLRGPWATADSDFTAKIAASQLPSGSRFAVTMAFEDENGTLGEAADGTFTTAAGRNAAGRTPVRGGDVPRGQSFVWTGDTAGQGWGINEEIGGMFAYSAMREAKPDFFVHSGDTIYADGPISAEVEEPDGQIWRNLVTEEVSKVAETLDEYRGRHRYNLMDANVRAFYSEVPVIAQWDDHETTNNWWHGEVLEDDRYTVRDVDTLAARGRRAWQEYQPIANPRAMRGGTGFEPARIYRKIERGDQLDLFSLDMRTFKGENTAGMEAEATSIFGEEQLQWLIKEVTRSKATWKVILSDLPLGIIVPDGDAQESISNADDGAPLGRELELARVLKAFKEAGVKNIVWLTADVHYCAAHHYSPERAAFTGFDPFWEFVAGPINAGSFGPSQMDGTFGPEVVFAKAGERANQSPRDGKSQFFGHVDLDEADTFTVSLRNALGETVFSKTLHPER
ncbi:alkaline phosphatase D family protein [Zhihengliuella salsuginis]|uniref:Extracelullar DNA degradation protein EddA n=1 Tax=Zhihengliuella salsuginis TaxID=578222 RepID=A0ABQ3GCS8_9MICC|nr:alkaline phosphatase D family protein [Zhihengliuella salsuginis]GHC99912.1 extracelullar DNA degradation protein EddA [Zhihengliuella salsuginis]